MQRFLATLSLSLLLLSCSSHHGRSVYFQQRSLAERTYVAADLEPRELASLPVVADRMSAFLQHPGYLRFTAVPTLEKVDRQVRVGGRDVVGGTYSPWSREIAIQIDALDDCVDDTPNARPSRDQCFQALLLHELGHSFGLQHVPSPAMMSAKLGARDFDFTDADRVECSLHPDCARSAL